MFGTIARLSLKPGMESRMQDHVKQYEGLQIPGHIATYTFKMDANPNEYYLAAIFENREKYFDNANSPEQDHRYRALLDLLTEEPEWHDGEIVYSEVSSGARTGLGR